jgi:hypothetical protein
LNDRPDRRFACAAWSAGGRAAPGHARRPRIPQALC